MAQPRKKLTTESIANTSREMSDQDLKYDEKKAGWCRQKFREDWCSESEFEGWLEEVPDDPFRAWCSCCQCTLLVGRSELLKHSATKKHKRAFQECKLVGPMMSVMDGKLYDGGSLSSQGPASKMPDEGLLRAELRLASFAVDHNLNTNAVEHLGNLFNVLSERLDVIPKIKMSVNKCSTIVNHVLMDSVQFEMKDLLKNHGYSIIIEEVEMCDPGRRAFAVIVRYYNETRNKTWNQLLGTLVVTDQDLMTNSLWKLMCILISGKAPLNNFTAVAADYASPLFNQTNFPEFGKLKDNLQIFYFSSRSMLTVMLNAVNTLPEGLETLMHHFGNLVTGQLKHVYRLTPEDLLPMLQEVTSFETRKHFQSSSPAEWLLNPNCTAILAQSLPLLISLLEKRITEGGSVVAEALVQEATNPYTKAYFLFLSYILTHFYNMHNLLRPNSINSYHLINDFLNQYRVLCQHFLAPAAFMISDLSKIDLEDEKNLLPEKSIFIGTECQEYLKVLETVEQTEQFMGQCRRLLQVAAIEIKNRIPLNDLVLNMLTFVDPEVAFRKDSRIAIPSLQPLQAKFPILIDGGKLDEQWLELPNYFSTSDVEELKKLPVDTMWGVIGDMRNSEDVLVFGALGKLAKIMLSLPTTDADVVMLTRMVSDVTNKLLPDEEMKMRLEMIPLKHTMLRSNTECYQQRVTMKNRKLYMLNVNKKEDFPEQRYIFSSD